MATGVGVEFDEYGRSIVGVIDWRKRFYSGEYQGVTLSRCDRALIQCARTCQESELES